MVVEEVMVMVVVEEVMIAVVEIERKAQQNNS